ncbi:SGNH/GDSL hydrolase family protein [Mycobacterium attenuatum]|uniref:SGNH/GDSL hydrolase family protein n=1 Tax=Mycobacterium attenuatum TaxID=2341086 RepID=UPI000F28FCC5|nr:SGNH/GDSL hydrolase family protein [Mycobacterium attenuatum]VBA47872.1 Lipase 2 [Mycobacterium attenuatum]
MTGRGKRYVALGSSMAAGPGIRPRAAGAPWRSGRSARNYPHLVAERHNLELVDVTYSGATTANVLCDPQQGAPPQITALDGSESLVTVTIGGNDIGYVPLLMAAALPRSARRMPLLGAWIAELLDHNSRDQALAQVFDSLCDVGRSLRRQAPRARVFFVDYLTLLPPAGVPSPPLSAADSELGRHVAATLERLTAEAAAITGCGVVRAAAASRDHHAWSPEPWTVKPARFGVSLPGRPAPLHPNGTGMRAVAELVAAQL